MLLSDMFFNKKIGIALGSGGAKGIAHIAVLRYLEYLDIKIDIIAGSSIGAIIGVIYAIGNLDFYEQEIMRFDFRKFLSFIDPGFAIPGMIKGEKLLSYMGRFIPSDMNIEDLKIKTAIVATEYDTGKMKVFTSGNILKALRASFAVPGFITPYNYNGKLYIDGGVVNQTPVDVVKKLGANKIIAVDLNSINPQEFIKKIKSKELNHNNHNNEEYYITKKNKTPSPLEVINRASDIMSYVNANLLLNIVKPNVLIRPELYNYSFLDFHKAKEILEKGYEACELEKNKLLALKGLF